MLCPLTIYENFCRLTKKATFYCSVAFTGKIMAKIIMEVIEKHMEYSAVISHS